MPEIKILDAVRPRDLMTGDTLHLGDETVIVAERPSVKNKYAYVSVEGRDRPLRLSLDVNQRVSREVPTAEEAETDRIERARSWIREEMLAAAQQVEKSKAALIESLVMKDVTWHGRRWEAYATAQTIAELWESVVKVAVVQEVDLVTATLMWRKEITKRLLADLRHPRWGSSGVTNAANALVAQVQAEWADDLRWYVVR
jgi:hypothetical protein